MFTPITINISRRGMDTDKSKTIKYNELFYQVNFCLLLFFFNKDKRD